MNEIRIKYHILRHVILHTSRICCPFLVFDHVNIFFKYLKSTKTIFFNHKLFFGLIYFLNGSYFCVLRVYMHILEI